MKLKILTLLATATAAVAAPFSRSSPDFDNTSAAVDTRVLLSKQDQGTCQFSLSQGQTCQFRGQMDAILTDINVHAILDKNGHGVGGTAQGGSVHFENFPKLLIYGLEKPFGIEDGGSFEDLHFSYPGCAFDSYTKQPSCGHCDVGGWTNPE